MSYNIGYALGVLVGVLLGAGVLCAILFFTTKNNTLKRDYDERQELVRGKGFKYGFFTTMIANMILGYLNCFLEKPIMDVCFSTILSVCLGVLVHVHYCIWKEGYFSLNEKPRTFIVIMMLCALSQYLVFAGNLKSGIIVDGVMTYRGVSLVVAVMGTFLLIDLLAKSIIQRREDD